MNKKYLIIIIFFFSIGFFIKPISTLALVVYTYYDISDIKINEESNIKIFIDTEDKEINVLEGKIKINGPVKISNINTNSSVFSLWAEEPEILVDQEINFTGGVAGGVYGKDLRLFDLNIERIGKGKITIEAIDISAYLNDGIGTKVENTNTNMVINQNSLTLIQILRSILIAVIIFSIINILLNIFKKNIK
jgi:hypothetical protein